MQVKLNHNFKQSFLCVIFSIIILFASLVSPPKASAFVITPGMAAVGTFVVAEALVPWLNGFMEANGEAFHNALLDALVNDEEDEMIAGIGRTTITSGQLGYPYAYEFVLDSNSTTQSVVDLLSYSSDYVEFHVNDVKLTEDLGHFDYYFQVAESGSYTLNLPAACGACSCGSSHTAYVFHKFYSSNDDGNSWAVLYNSSTKDETSFTVSLYTGYVYKFTRHMYGSSVTAGVYASGYHCFSYGCPYLTGGAVVNDVPASTRPSGLSTVINDYNTQNINTGGNYTNYYIGTVDANGDVVDVYDFDIFDESTMTINNPASGDTWTATAWEYDYETRSYYCTLEDDQYVRITYGDDYVTIIYPDDEGTYHEQYYYYITAEYAADSSGSGTACDHVYTSETTTLPTCTESGWRTYTCQLCGYSYESSVPATGHIWEATETVETEMNENGDVTKLGYTVYTCTSCGETYTAYMQDGQPTEPPGSSSGGGIFSWLGEQFKKLVSAVVDGLASGLEYLVKNVIGAVTDWLLRVVNWLFDLFDGEALGSFFNWFSDGNEILNNEWASGSSSSGSSSSGSSSSSTVTEVDLWAYSLG